ncbi:hypothetical protein HMPREF3192_01289 [Atopobium deltae]|uniref:Uncharacterized protein n=1 Tax=Atopobium deltae TaxID=1393034 RepID=A0A133XPQ5_9ACTN|nr:hypothetical protein HMPREF3192_01289 [Atopobium deltae]
MYVCNSHACSLSCCNLAVLVVHSCLATHAVSTCTRAMRALNARA